MATQSYLPETAGGVVVAAAFADQQRAQAAIDVLHASGVRPQDVSLIARDRAGAERIAAGKAWTPSRNEPKGPFARVRAAIPFLGGGLPRELRKRYGGSLRAGRFVIVVAAGGQPPDTLEALLAQAGGGEIASWWSGPLSVFAPPELAGPF